jgi:hypothetical protein
MRVGGLRPPTPILTLRQPEDLPQVQNALCSPTLHALGDHRPERLVEGKRLGGQLPRWIGMGQRRHGGTGGLQMIAELRLQLRLRAFGQSIAPRCRDEHTQGNEPHNAK